MALDQFDQLIETAEDFGIAKDTFLKLGQSAMHATYFELNPTDESRAYVDRAKQQFNELCDAAPGVPREAVEFLSAAFGLHVATFLQSEEKQADEEGCDCEWLVETLMDVSSFMGVARGLAKKADGLLERFQSEQREMLSQAGAKGAAAKHRRHAEMKRWVLEKAATLRGDDMSLARKLSASLPPELADVSANPQRFIYDVLRSRPRGD